VTHPERDVEGARNAVTLTGGFPPFIRSSSVTLAALLEQQ
jgi:hypothetical protein